MSNIALRKIDVNSVNNISNWFLFLLSSFLLPYVNLQYSKINHNYHSYLIILQAKCFLNIKFLKQEKTDPSKFHSTEAFIDCTIAVKNVRNAKCTLGDQQTVKMFSQWQGYSFFSSGLKKNHLNENHFNVEQRVRTAIETNDYFAITLMTIII